jgi:hypothetical protein
VQAAAYFTYSCLVVRQETVEELRSLNDELVPRPEGTDESPKK